MLGIGGLARDRHSLYIMLNSHCCPIHYERFVAVRGILLNCRLGYEVLGLCFLNTICYAQILYDDDWSISGDTIFQDLVSLSDRSKYYHMIRSYDCPDPVHDG